jgi:hypothetical protein
MYDSLKLSGQAILFPGARTVPALAYCSDEPAVEIITCAWPSV